MKHQQTRLTAFMQAEETIASKHTKATTARSHFLVIKTRLRNMIVQLDLLLL